MMISNFKEILEQFIGPYTSDPLYQGIAAIDWQWLMTAFIFGVIIYCVFRFLCKIIERMF